MTKKNVYITGALIAMAITVCYVDAVVKPDYFTKIPVKIVCFLIVPTLFFVFFKEEAGEFKKLFKGKKEGIKNSFLLGLAIYGVVFGGFLLTRGIIDYSNVSTSLSEGMGITAENLIYVSLYMSIMNSLLEEYFFRGFGFIALKKHTSRKFAYVFSSAMFAAYHVGMILDMFHPLVLLIILAGLFVGGCIFSYVNEINENIYPSWIVHMFADFAINTVGFVLYGMLPSF